MDYAGFLLRHERTKRNWSQEGLCKGICTVSYLSKIEQGKAEPSGQILQLLMERLGVQWKPASRELDQWWEETYECLFDHGKDFSGRMKEPDIDSCRYSPYGPDLMLLKIFAADARQSLDPCLEPCLNNRQLALQRLLQGRYEEAVRLHPSAFFYAAAGTQYYSAGQLVQAIQTLQTAYQLAAQEGRAQVMLHCKTTMGNCCSNQFDLTAMQAHYQVARRLARALGDWEYLESIAYNTAATQLEAGQYEKALAYFGKLENPRKMDLHKLAICYEKLGMRDAALEALDRAEGAAESQWIPDGLEAQMLELVRLRLEDPRYLKNAQYGRTLLDCFDRCRRELSSGYAGFHLNWVLEWLEGTRQYKQALQLLKDFPERMEK